MKSRLAFVLIGVAALLCARPAPAQTPAENTPPSQEVRVTFANGARSTGRLVSLSETEVVVREKRSAHDSRYPVSDVTRVETVHHTARNLAAVGAISGVVVALASDLCGTGRPYGSSGPSGEPDCITAKPALIIGGMAGLGAVIGAAIDGNRKRVLYRGPSSPPTIAIAAVTARRGAGLRVTVRW